MPKPFRSQSSLSPPAIPRDASQNSICRLLKQATTEQHRRIESLVELPRSVADHVRTLEIFFGFVEPWEQRLTRYSSDWPLRLLELHKTTWLTADLRHFGRTTRDLDNLPRCQSVPSIENLSQAMGSVYVLEGASLGGQIVARHLERNLKLFDGRGYQFYESYGIDVGRRWNEFKSTIETHASPANRHLIVNAAIETFERLYDWFACSARLRRAPRPEEEK